MFALAALDGFQANFAFVLGTYFADPDHNATHRVQRVFIQDDFDNLTPSQMEAPAQPEAVF